MKDEPPAPIDYGTPKPISADERFERNGWIGMIITLLACLIAFFVGMFLLLLLRL